MPVTAKALYRIVNRTNLNNLPRGGTTARNPGPAWDEYAGNGPGGVRGQLRLRRGVGGTCGPRQKSQKASHWAVTGILTQFKFSGRFKAGLRLGAPAHWQALSQWPQASSSNRRCHSDYATGTVSATTVTTSSLPVPTLAAMPLPVAVPSSTGTSGAESAAAAAATSSLPRARSSRRKYGLYGHGHTPRQCRWAKS